MYLVKTPKCTNVNLPPYPSASVSVVVLATRRQNPKAIKTLSILKLHHSAIITFTSTRQTQQTSTYFHGSPSSCSQQSPLTRSSERAHNPRSFSRPTDLLAPQPPYDYGACNHRKDLADPPPEAPPGLHHQLQKSMPAAIQWTTVGMVVAWYGSNIGVLLLNKYLLMNCGFRFSILHLSQAALVSLPLSSDTILRVDLSITSRQFSMRRQSNDTKTELDLSTIAVTRAFWDLPSRSREPVYVPSASHSLFPLSPPFSPPLPPPIHRRSHPSNQTQKTYFPLPLLFLTHHRYLQCCRVRRRDLL
ncbi:hypothetical protein ACFX14_014821 [Malus domestica]